jgi:hypothetical protein
MTKKNIGNPFPHFTGKLRSFSTKDMKKFIFGLPPGGENFYKICRCGIRHTIDWNSPIGEDAAPRMVNGKFTTLSGLRKICVSCGDQIELLFEKSEMKDIFHFYGDESYEKYRLNQSILFVYGFVELRGSIHNLVLNELLKFKSICKPADDPRSWPLHMVDIMNGHWRAKQGIAITKDELYHGIKSIIRSLNAKNGNGRHLAVFVNLSSYPRPMNKIQTNEVRDNSLIASIISITDKMTKENRGIEPRFILESVEKSHKNNMIDPFVESIGRTLYCVPQYHYVGRGLINALPVTIGKGDAFQLE